MADYQLILGDCVAEMKKLPDESVDLVVTSPPYNVGKDYGEHDDSQQAGDYYSFIYDFLKGCYDKTKIGGRLCLNVPFTGNSVFLAKSSELQFYPIEFVELAKKAGWTFRDFVIWVKTREPENPNNFSGDSTQWGSWNQPSCPYLRCFAETILVFHKQDKKLQHQGKTDLTRDEFLEFTKNVWYFPAETRRNGHPAPFPEELPRRCIKLFTWIGDVCFDPFMGTGTTGRVALSLGRKFIGIEKSQVYYDLAKDTINHRLSSLGKEPRRFKNGVTMPLLLPA